MNINLHANSVLLASLVAVVAGCLGACSVETRDNDLPKSPNTFLDGTCDHECWIMSYDSQGHLTSRKKDVDCDGVAEQSCDDYSYSDKGILQRESIASNDCGSNDPTYCLVSTYDARGRLATIAWDQACTQDQLDTCRTFSYDDKGREASVIGRANCPHIFDPKHCVTWEYNQNGREGTVHATEDCETSKVGAITEKLDADDRVLQRRIDWDNGNDPFCAAWTYDDQGRLLSSSQDEGCNGELINCVEKTYNADGTPRTERQDVDCKGPADVCKTWKNYDDMGMVVERIEIECKPENSICMRRYYDENGRLRATERDIKCDGETESCHRVIIK